MDSSMSPEERIKAFVGFTAQKDENWQSRISPYVKLVSIKSDRPHPAVTFSFLVDECHNNATGNMHGGAIATLFDWATSMPLALIAKPGFWSYMGVTRNLAVSYLRPAPVGTECLLEAEVVSAGRSLALLKGTLRRKSDGAILATCTHDKVNTDPPPSKM
ncbi:hypothetical protein PWT90_01684 [Aphanocladium album]|nr:hypothetical protein PWT90_01684 [Aphanocladium album]